MRPVGTTMPRRRSPLRTLAGAVLVLALLLTLLLVAAGLVAQERLDQDGLRLRVEREVLRQTGRRLALGTLRLELLPVPTLRADGLALANWPGHGEPEMLTADAVTAHLALLPLLHHVVRLEGVTLTRPNGVLQRDPDGTANWQMHRQAPPGGGSSSGGGGVRWRIEIGSVRLRDGRLAWRDGLRGWTGAVTLDRLDGSGLAGHAPSVTLAGRHGGAGFDADLATGPLDRLLASTPAGGSWPLRISAREQADGREVARLSVAGTVADPGRGRGYALDVAAQASRLDALDALFPHAALPAVEGVSVRMRLDDAGAARPTVQSLDLRTGAFPAGALLRSRWLRDLSARSLSVQAGASGAKLALSLDGTWRGQNLALHGTAGTLSEWQAGAGAVPVSLELSVADARARLDGTAGRAGSDLRLAVQAPALQPVLGMGPALTALVLSTRLQIGPGDRYALSELSLESRELNLSGDAAAQGAAHPVVTAALASTHADLDALRAGWQGGPGAAGPAHAGAVPSQPAPPPPAATVGARSDAVPFAALRLAELSIRLDAQELRLGGARYRDLKAQLSVQDGRLSLAPSVTGPAGAIAGRLEADASARSVGLTLQPSMVPAGTLAALAGVAPELAGTVELVGELHGTGDTVQAVAASLSGQAGASLVDGSIANRALSQVVGRPVGLPDGGRTAVRCLALPAHVRDGVATLPSLALQTGRLDVQGHGTVGLGDGRLDLHLLPRLSLGVGGASLPVHVGGTLGAPAPALDPAAPGGRFALTIGPGGPAPDLCGPALQAARFGAPGPQPGPLALDRPRKAPKPIDILRGLGLFR